MLKRPIIKTFRVDAAECQRLEALAAAAGVTVSEYLRRLIATDGAR